MHAADLAAVTAGEVALHAFGVALVDNVPIARALEQGEDDRRLLGGEGDRYVVDEGDAKGMKGYFARGDDGQVSGVHFGGRLATRIG